MGKKMAAPGRSDAAAAKAERKNHQHRAPASTSAPANRVDCAADINDRAGAYIEGFYRKLEVHAAPSVHESVSTSNKCFRGVDHQHRAPAPSTAPANRVDCVADIDDCAGAFIKCFRRQLEDQEMIMKNNTSSTTTTTTTGGALSLTSLNHISLVCRSVERSLEFYQNVLGFIPIRRPESLKFDGAWLFNYGMIIHLLQSEDPEGMPKKSEINLKDNHFSFQCESMAAVERKLSEMGILYIKEGGGDVSVDQLFFHDPDGFLIEIRNCEIFPAVVPITGGDPVLVCKSATAAANTGSTP